MPQHPLVAYNLFIYIDNRNAFNFIPDRTTTTKSPFFMSTDKVWLKVVAITGWKRLYCQAFLTFILWIQIMTPKQLPIELAYFNAQALRIYQ